MPKSGLSVRWIAVTERPDGRLSAGNVEPVFNSKGLVGAMSES
jgi:hypothetical protein